MQRNSVMREGLTAGIIGATIVAVLFFFVDLARGHPFAVPAGLGHLVLHLFGFGEGASQEAKVAIYTVFHFGAFAVVGIVAAAVVRHAETEPTILAGALIAFVMAEIGFYGLSFMLTESRTLGYVSWYQVAIGNLLAAAAMGWYLWRQHPGLAGQARSALGNTRPE